MYIHKHPASKTSNLLPYIASFDPGMNLGMLIHRYNNSKTIAAGVINIGKKITWMECCNNLFVALDEYKEQWERTRIVVIERQTRQNDRMTMIESYIVAYFMRYNCFVISLERSSVITFMKSYINGLERKREILKSKFIEYTLEHIDDFGLKVMNANKRNHDIADCYIMVMYIISKLDELVKE